MVSERLVLGPFSREALMHASSREEQLLAEGWKKQSTLGEPRLSEAVQTYREIGFEVILVTFDPEQESSCTICMQNTPEKYQTVFTRPR
jgi:hypothetical protein